ncbi:MAG: hypothetical protein ACI9VS_003652, partial [Candidatus Binatia bacterium]
MRGLMFTDRSPLHSSVVNPNHLLLLQQILRNPFRVLAIILIRLQLRQTRA